MSRTLNSEKSDNLNSSIRRTRESLRASLRSFKVLQTIHMMVQCVESIIIFNNYSLKWRWLAVDIYGAAKRQGKYQPLATSTEVNSCFSIY